VGRLVDIRRRVSPRRLAPSVGAKSVPRRLWTSATSPPTSCEKQYSNRFVTRYSVGCLTGASLVGNGVEDPQPCPLLAAKSAAMRPAMAPNTTSAAIWSTGIDNTVSPWDLIAAATTTPKAVPTRDTFQTDRHLPA